MSRIAPRLGPLEEGSGSRRLSDDPPESSPTGNESGGNTHQETWVDYDLDDRAPLLFISGGKDHLMPPAVIRSNAKKYRGSEALTDFYEFPERSHFTGVEPGWEQVADYALNWAVSHARAPRS
ncbi:hypothetical protein ACIA5D_39480 [Actinoplanes sp. NPDC051513]|uniref:hypothetical protein n=1 Tax=Actinoplanes sp. NPDC051513 TaxID=3363908 RepID=UPI0037A1A322